MQSACGSQPIYAAVGSETYLREIVSKDKKRKRLHIAAKEDGDWCVREYCPMYANAKIHKKAIVMTVTLFRHPISVTLFLAAIFAVQVCAYTIWSYSHVTTCHRF
jgi:hypothetical protein